MVTTISVVSLRPSLLGGIAYLSRFAGNRILISFTKKACSNIYFLTHFVTTITNNPHISCLWFKAQTCGVRLSLPLFLFRRGPFFISCLSSVFSSPGMLLLFLISRLRLSIFVSSFYVVQSFAFILSACIILFGLFVLLLPLLLLLLLQRYDPIMYVQQRRLLPTYILNPRPYENKK